MIGCLRLCGVICVKSCLFDHRVNASLKIRPVNAVCLFRIIFSITALSLAVIALRLAEIVCARILCFIDIFNRGALPVDHQVFDGILGELSDAGGLHDCAHKLFNIFICDRHVTLLKRACQLVYQHASVCPASHNLLDRLQIEIIIVSCHFDSCLSQLHLDLIYNRYIRLHINASRVEALLLHLLKIFP